MFKKSASFVLVLIFYVYKYQHDAVVQYTQMSNKRIRPPGGASEGASAPSKKSRITHESLFDASQNGHAEVVSMLLAKEGVDVNQTKNRGVTPLLIASQNGHAEVVSMLLATRRHKT